MPTYTTLRGIHNVDDDSLVEILEENLMEFFNWGLLEAGGYTDATVTNLGVNDPTDDSMLIPVHMPGQPDGRIWQSPHRNWVWESGLDSERQPLPVSGVYVDGTFYDASTSGAFAYFVNYPDGRVVFEQPIPTTSVVQASYSYRWVNFYDQEVPWFRDVVFDAYRFEVGEDAQPSGVLGLLQEYQVQLPAVIIETVPTRRFVPKQIGDGSQWVYQDFLFHVLTDRSDDRNFLIDAITLQKDKTFYLFDTNARAAANKFALDWHGSLVSNAMTYPMLVDMPPSGFRFKRCIFNRMAGQESSGRLPLFRAIIRATLEVDFTNL